MIDSILVAGTGFEPVTFGLWARRAAKLLHPAIDTTNIWNISLNSASVTPRDAIIAVIFLACQTISSYLLHFFYFIQLNLFYLTKNLLILLIKLTGSSNWAPSDNIAWSNITDVYSSKSSVPWNVSSFSINLCFGFISRIGLFSGVVCPAALRILSRFPEISFSPTTRQAGESVSLCVTLTSLTLFPRENFILSINILDFSSIFLFFP